MVNFKMSYLFLGMFQFLKKYIAELKKNGSKI